MSEVNRQLSRVPRSYHPKLILRQLPTLRELDTLCESAYSCIDGVAFFLKPLALVPKILEWHGEGLDEFVVFQLGFRILIFRQRHVYHDMYHAQIGIAEAGI
jgi:hypothetical protein